MLALAAMLRRRSIEVVVASDAAAAIRVAINARPDALVLDIALPGGDGTAVMERLHGLPQFATVPVVMLSGMDPKKYREAALAAGAVAYLTKPIDESELLAALKVALPDLDVSMDAVAGPVDLAGRRILLVDDDDDFLMATAALLRPHGVQVIVAGDAITATSTAVRERPDLVVLDIGLPGGDGTLVMRRLHAMPQLAGVPVVIFEWPRSPEVRCGRPGRRCGRLLPSRWTSRRCSTLSGRLWGA